ncbi:hypothetical protein B0H13DRAFT_1648388, partial [Mycena leptocephala]
IRELFQFRNLTSLSLGSRDGFDLDDSTLLDMALSWPHIETLELTVVSDELADYIRTPSATLQCLRSFAEHCPRLTDLGIEFDASVIPSSNNSDSSAHLIPQTTLRRIHLGQTAISAPVSDVASFLEGIFPNLQELDTGHSEWGDEDPPRPRVIYHRLWQQVERLLPNARELPPKIRRMKS